MPVRVISLKCPECGAQLTVEADRNYSFCSYCGTKILIQNENERVYRHVDEAGIKKAEVEKVKAETDRIIQLKHLEFEVEKHAAKKKAKQIRTIIALALIGIAIILFLLSGANQHFSVLGMIFFLMAIFIIFIINPSEDEEKRNDTNREMLDCSLFKKDRLSNLRMKQ